MMSIEKVFIILFEHTDILERSKLIDSLMSNLRVHKDIAKVNYIERSMRKHRVCHRKWTCYKLLGGNVDFL